MPAPLSCRPAAAVTARAALQQSRARPFAARIVEVLAVFIAAAALVSATSPASAQVVGAAATIVTDDRFRGYSVSDGRPAAILDISYDAPSGIYAALSASATATRDYGPRLLAAEINAGYVRPLSSGLDLDIGATGSSYSRYSGMLDARSYIEAYAGIEGKRISSRLSYSPRYLGGWDETLYAEVNANFGSFAGFRLNAHAGLLHMLGRHREGAYRSRYDWRLGVTRTVGRFTMEAAWSGRGSGGDPYGGGYDLSPRRSARQALTFAISTAL